MKEIKAKIAKVSGQWIFSNPDFGLKLSAQVTKRLKGARRIFPQKLVSLNEFTKKYGKN